MNKKKNNVIMSLVDNAKDKFMENCNGTILANPKETFPKYVKYAEDSRKDHVKLIEKNIDSKVEIANETNKFYSERIKAKEKLLQEVDLSAEERQQIQAEIKACEARVEARYDDAANAGSEAIEEDRNFSIGFFIALLSLGTGIGGLAFAVNKVK